MIYKNAKTFNTVETFYIVFKWLLAKIFYYLGPNETDYWGKNPLRVRKKGMWNYQEKCSETLNF